jgi:hypothetical protein
VKELFVSKNLADGTIAVLSVGEVRAIVPATAYFSPGGKKEGGDDFFLEVGTDEKL